jgi:hypothetical protein
MTTKPKKALNFSEALQRLYACTTAAKALKFFQAMPADQQGLPPCVGFVLYRGIGEPHWSMDELISRLDSSYSLEDLAHIHIHLSDKPTGTELEEERLVKLIERVPMEPDDYMACLRSKRYHPHLALMVHQAGKSPALLSKLEDCILALRAEKISRLWKSLFGLVIHEGYPLENLRKKSELGMHEFAVMVTQAKTVSRSTPPTSKAKLS